MEIHYDVVGIVTAHPCGFSVLPHLVIFPSSLLSLDGTRHIFFLSCSLRVACIDYQDITKISKPLK